MTKKTSIPSALTIAGSDPSGGAGLQADSKTFHQHKVYSMSVITLLTAQNTKEVTNMIIMDGDFIKEQLNTLFSDIVPNAIKTGALGESEAITSISNVLKNFKEIPLVVDPVMVTSSGTPLFKPDNLNSLIRELIPLSLVVTPNLEEAKMLTEMEISSIKDAKKAAKKIKSFGAKNVIVKGGHYKDNANDLILTENEEFILLEEDHIETTNTHGTGCTYSASITANLAKGIPLLDSIRKAKKFITKAIKEAPQIGQGIGPVNHFVRE